MTAVVAQRGLGPPAPYSRQDIVSALLNDYGNSFGRGDSSPSTYSPVPAEKELPPPPSESEPSETKPLPAFQRAEKRMSRKFPLRSHDDAPPSPASTCRDSPERRPRKRIVYRSLSRDGKPPSLTLTISNGSTATIPLTPVSPGQARIDSALSDFGNKDLPSPPPPPPEKSGRRPGAQAPSMGLHLSKAQRELARNDSLLSQSEMKAAQKESPAGSTTSPVVKRKAMPVQTMRKFKSLAELGSGPRGRTGGPLPPTYVPRKVSVDSPNAQPSDGAQPLSAMTSPPPTPDKEEPAAVQNPPRKTLGLPSNPRGRSGPISPKHVRGKSSTGFNLLKAQRPAPPVPTMVVETLTPEMTPSPTLKPVETREHDLISPVSPLPPPKEQLRPFSYEALTPPDTQAKATEQAANLSTPDVSTLPAATENRASKETSSIGSMKANFPGTTIAPASETTTLESTVQELPPRSPLPFIPLTKRSVAMPETLNPRITNTHLDCYANHRHNIWSNNVYQPMGCMICHLNEKDMKWMCTWCQLRICMACSGELRMVPGRDLQRLLDARVNAEAELEEQQGGAVDRAEEAVAEVGRVAEA